MKKIYLLVTVCLASCTNPYAKFYQGATDVQVQPYYDPLQAALEIYSTDDFERDTKALLRRGYSPIGESSFQAGSNSVSESDLREQAAKIGAHVVLVASKYSHTVSGAVPLNIPKTTTSYSSGSATAYGSGGTVNAYGNSTTTTYGSQTVMMPYAVNRSDFGARYFVKTKSRLGVTPQPVTDELRRKIKTNAGVSVYVVTEGTSAFAADVLPDDIILSIGDDAIQSVEHFYRLLDKYQGQKPSFKIVREGKTLKKQIEIRTYEEQADSSLQ
ncbi:MAG: PDZ domain-containing protein [Pseudomonadota bacterium]